MIKKVSPGITGNISHDRHYSLCVVVATPKAGLLARLHRFHLLALVALIDFGTDLNIVSEHWVVCCS